MKKIIKEIALQVGGSHYPDVGGQLLEKFADTVVLRCALIANKFDDTGAAKSAILREFEIKDE